MLIATLTGTTCSFPCWYAHEKVCRCSCGGKNHGALLDPKNPTPERIVTIAGHKYRLEAVGQWSEINTLYRRFLMRLGWAKIDPTVTYHDTQIPYHQAYFVGNNYKGAPAIVKKATDRQYIWPELKMMGNVTLYLLWVALEQPTPTWCKRVEECPKCASLGIDIWATYADEPIDTGWD